MRCLLIVLSSFLIQGCGGEDEQPTFDFSPKRPRLLTTGAPLGDVRVLGRGTLQFGRELFVELEKEPGNFVFSPLSAHLSVGMLTHGMEREGREATRKPLFTDLFGLRFESAASTLIHRIFEDASTLDSFHLGTSFWLQDGLTFEEPFLRRVVDFYGQQLFSADFEADSDEVTKEIDEWIAQQSSRAVTRSLDTAAIRDDAKLVSASVVGMKGQWYYKFDREKTGIEPFQLSGGNVVNVPMMHLDAATLYSESETWQVVFLPFDGDKFGLTLFVPKRSNGLSKAINLTDGIDLSLLIDGLIARRVSLALPRASIQSNQSVANAVSSAGLKQLFDSSTSPLSTVLANSDSTLPLSAITNAAAFDFEEGGKREGEQGGDNLKAVEVRCDRPFLFMVRHRGTGAVILMGRVADPRE